LYGTTNGGGSSPQCYSGGCGTVFKITPAGTLTTVYNFCTQTNCTDGVGPVGGLALATDGNFYGTLPQSGANRDGAIFKITPRGTLTTLYSFCSQPGCPDGGGVSPVLAQATDGDLYGVTLAGGVNGGYGTVFKITLSGKLTTLHSFNGADGWSPYAGLIQGTDGNFYGTTQSTTTGGGTIFKITPVGKLTTLHTFNGADGNQPVASLVQAADGNFYGTTLDGGPTGEGTVFRITPGGTLTTLYSFCPQPGCVDGQFPEGALIQATDGNLYGTTGSGGTGNCTTYGTGGCGTVFEITLRGVLTTLHTFDSTDGAYLWNALVQHTDGSFYGTTSFGGDVGCDPGSLSGCGTVFSLNMGLGPFVAFVHDTGKVGQTGGILGQGFTGTTSVSLNGIPAAFTVKSDTFITATVPPGATTGYVTVATPSGTLTSNVPFRVLQ
jgi:uncharacterized repeat protein (TIGR03803 family)